MRKSIRVIAPFAILVAVVVTSFYLYLSSQVSTSNESIAQNKIQVTYTNGFSNDEKAQIEKALDGEGVTSSLAATVATQLSTGSGTAVLNSYVVVTSNQSSTQAISLKNGPPPILLMSDSVSNEAASAIAELIGATNDFTRVSIEDGISENEVVLIPASALKSSMKLLSIDGDYYLDSYTSGAIFRSVSFAGEEAARASSLTFNNLPTKEDIATVIQTGVTALTRVMMRKLEQVNDPLYFSAKIGDFLSDADLTHISNEVSFRDGCEYSYTAFCSDPRFIETLKASGVDLVELTGNHNNDVGSEYNTATINLYHELGWATFGGGLNETEAAKYHVADIKDTKIAFIGYNYPDSPGGYAIAQGGQAGANRFDMSFTSIESDIAAAKQEADFVIVDVQYWECYSYPDGYIEFPECDLPIGDQEEVFKKLADLGADMVVGSQAHQPQIYETYNGVPIYYGLGNLYFDQTQWPGTERGLILTHYFDNGELIQTKVTPTFYDTDLQTQITPVAEAEQLLERLAR